MLIKHAFAEVPLTTLATIALGNGDTTPALNIFLSPFFPLIQQQSLLELLDRERNVTQYAIEGEILSSIHFGANTLVGEGKDHVIPLINSSASANDRHSMALMTAIQASPEFHAVIQKLPYLVSELLNDKLFAKDALSQDRDILRHLLRHQLGIAGEVTSEGKVSGRIAPDAMLTRFSADMETLVKTNIPDPQLNLGKALVAFAMERYYEETTGTPDAQKQLFTAITGGLQFNTSAISSVITSAKGYTEYFSDYLNNCQLFSEDELTAIREKINGLKDWSIAVKEIGMNATGNGNQPALMLGNKGNDHLVGGGEDDLLIGGEGNDYLQGNAGNDSLYGGASNDMLYGNDDNEADLLNGGAGEDTYYAGNRDIIQDSDGQGTVFFQNKALSGGDYQGARQWNNGEGLIFTLLNAADGKSDLSVRLGDQQILIQNYHQGDLGIQLNGGAVPQRPPSEQTNITVNGDRVPYQQPWDYWAWITNPNWPYLFNSYGNLIYTDIPQPYFADKIFDGPGDDKIYAGHGHNVIYAYNGGNNLVVTGDNDDYIWAGDGNDRILSGGLDDIVMAGAGKDYVYGGDGRDVIDGGQGDDLLEGGIGNRFFSFNAHA